MNGFKGILYTIGGYVLFVGLMIWIFRFTMSPWINPETGGEMTRSLVTRISGWIGLLTSLPIAIWLIISWLNIVNPEEVALRQYFGHVERRKKNKEPLTNSNGLLGSGLHFVPWFPGIKLIRTPKKMFNFVYEGDPKKPSYEISGTQLAVRSRDRQKLGIDVNFFLRFPYKDVDLMILLIESEVPRDDEEALKDWVQQAFATDMVTVFGRYNYEEVMGGLKNADLDKEMNEILQNPKGVFAKCGLCDRNPATINEEGFGEAYLRIEYVHVSGELGKRLELVETAKQEANAKRGVAAVNIETAVLEAEAKKRTAEVMIETAKFEAEAKRTAALIGIETAKSVADQEAEETHGRVFKMVCHAYGMTKEALSASLAANPKLKGTPEASGGYKEAFDRAYEQVVRETTDVEDVRIGNTDGTPMDGTVGTIIGGLVAFLQGKGESKPKGRGKKKKPKSDSGQKGNDDDDDVWDSI